MSDTQTIDLADRATPTGEPDSRDKAAWLAALLAIDDADIDAAKQLYIDHAPRAFRGLATGDGFTFDEQRQVYTRDATGKDINPRDVKQVSLLLALAIAQELEDEGRYVASGVSPIDLWQDATANKTKDLSLAQTALASGGFTRLTPAMLEAMKGSEGKPPGLAFSLSKLYDFAGDIAARADRANTVSGIVNRSGLYSHSQSGVYEQVSRASHQLVRDEKGRRVFLWERNILGEAEHCDECPELSDMGWVEIGTMPPPGGRECGPRCRCAMTYSLTGSMLDPRA